MKNPRRFASSLPAYAFDAVAKAPSKRFPVKAAPKQFSVAALGNGIQLATIEDSQSPISSLSLVITAGPRFQEGIKQQGVSQWLKASGFKTTNTRSTIRITREADLQGHSLTSALTREHLLLNVDFRRDDLPEAVELLADIVDGFTRRDNEPWGIYSREFVRKTKEWSDAKHTVETESEFAKHSEPATMLMDNLHQVAFRSGLGNQLYPVVSDISIPEVFSFVGKNFVGQRISLIGFGVNPEDLKSIAAQQFSSVPAGSATAAAHSKYFGGESFVQSSGGNYYALALHGSSLSHQDYFTSLVLRELLGGNTKSCGKYLANSSLLSGAPAAVAEAFNYSYTDSGLFGVYASGEDAAAVDASVKHFVQTLKSVAAGKVNDDEHVKRAVQAAKLAVADEYDSASRLDKIKSLASQLAVGKKLFTANEQFASLDQVNASKLSLFAGKLLKSGKPSIAAVGDIFTLPHADQLGF